MKKRGKAKKWEHIGNEAFGGAGREGVLGAVLVRGGHVDVVQEEDEPLAAGGPVLPATLLVQRLLHDCLQGPAVGLGVKIDDPLPGRLACMRVRVFYVVCVLVYLCRVSARVCACCVCCVRGARARVCECVVCGG